MRSTLREIDLVRAPTQHLERAAESQPSIDTNPIGGERGEEHEHAAHASECELLVSVPIVACSKSPLRPQPGGLARVPIEPRGGRLDEVKLGRLTRLAQALCM